MKLQLSFPKFKLEESAFSIKGILSITMCLMASVLQAQSDTISLKNVVVTGTRAATTTRNLPVTVSVVDRHALTVNQRTNVLPTLTEQVPGIFVSQRAIMGFGVSVLRC